MYITGIDIVLYTTTESGADYFGRPIYTETPITVSNVLVAKPSTQEIADELELTGKRVQYTLCIPKGDTNEWENKKVEFFGKTFKTIGAVSEYIEHLVPLSWNKQIKVEAYE